MLLTTPQWVNQEFLTKCLLAKYGHVKIKDSTCEAAVPAGSNFTSDLYRICISFTRNNNETIEKASIIVKIEPACDDLEKIIKEMQLFKKEIKMYSEILPKMTKLLNLNADETFYPQCLLAAVETTAKSVLVMDDLKVLKFKVQPLLPGLDFAHCELTLKGLAKYHAAGVLLVRDDPSIKNLYTKGIFYGPTKEWVIRGLESLISVCERNPDLNKYADKVTHFKKIADGKFVELLEDKDGFKVLLHGDTWTNNMLYNYDNEEKPLSVKLIDYQLVNYGNPQHDLHYFFTICPDLAIRKIAIPQLLDIYYDQFHQGLVNVGYNDNKNPVPTKEQFLKNYNKSSFYALFTAVTSAPLAMGASNQKDATYINMMSPEEEPGSFRYHCYNNPGYMTYIRHVLPYLDSINVFNNVS